MSDGGAACVGLDLGSSGCRACAIDLDGGLIGESRHRWPAVERRGQCAEEPRPQRWWEGVLQVLRALAASLAGQRIVSLAVDGTSPTLLLVDAQGRARTRALMYHDTQARHAAERIAAVAPTDSAARGAGSGLAKLLHLRAEPGGEALYPAHQADWVAWRLLGRRAPTDSNNALKLGYDVVNGEWPAWLGLLDLPETLLPPVQAPGRPLGEIDPGVARSLGWPTDVCIASGTTDGVAAVLATGIETVGDAATTLGTTTVLKVVSERPVFDAAHGVYSHRLGDRWLAGGASNSGGGVLSQHFSARHLDQLSARLRPEQPTGLDYYPLPSTGERFPVNDPDLESRIDPRPDDDQLFLQGLLEGIAEIERRGYRLLEELGAPYPRRVWTAGGGAGNEAWTRIRSRVMGVPTQTARWTQPCMGAARLALSAWREVAP